jgi:hypothetical protein
MEEKGLPVLAEVIITIGLFLCTLAFCQWDGGAQ